MKNTVKAATSSFRSSLDGVSRTQIAGWAFDATAPTAQVAIVVSANGAVICRAVADQLRPDLARAGIGDGFHAFTIDLAGKLRDEVGYRIDVVRDSDGTPLENSPATLEPVAREPARLSGCLDTLTRRRLSGWAVDGDNHVGLVVTANGRVIANVLANRYRPDLKEAGFGDGRHAFDIQLPELSALIAHEVHVRRQSDGAELPGSPMILAAAVAFDESAQATFATLLAGIDSHEAEARALAFLAKQTDLLLSRRADRESGRAAREARSQHRRRWGMLADDDPVAAGFARAPGLRALVIDDRVPVSGRDAGSVAILSHMRALRALRYQVSFVAARAMHDSVAAAELEKAEDIACFGAPFYATVEDVLSRQASAFDIVYLHRLSNAGDYTALVRTHQPKAWVVYSVADLHHLRVARQGQVQQRSELENFGHQLAFREFVAARLADAVITHSPVEAKILMEKIAQPKVHVVPWTVPLRCTPVPFGRRADIAVIGQFGHPPNPDAVFWFSRQVMPMVWAMDPAIKCFVVGYDWTAASLAGSDPRIEVLGPVDDLARIFDRVRLTVAPLRFGAGIKGKVLESFAAGIPCVMSPIAAEGLELPPPLPALVAENPEAMAAAVLRMHGDEAANQAAQAAGLEFIAATMSNARVLEAMKEALPAVA